MATENKKFTDSGFWKVLLTILVIILSIFFIFGLIGRLVQVIMKNQQKKVDKLMSKLILSKVVNNEKDFRRIANYKSRIYFFKHAMPAIFILLATLLLYIVSISVYSGMNNGEYVSMFYLFGRTIYPWQGQIHYVFPLGFDTSELVAVTPFNEFSTWYIIISIVTISLLIIGLVYYFSQVSGYLARKYRINKLADSMFTKNLDDIDLMHFINTQNSTILDDKDNKLPVAQNNANVSTLTK